MVDPRRAMRCETQIYLFICIFVKLPHSVPVVPVILTPVSSQVEALQSEIAVLAKRLRYEVSVRAQECGWKERHCR